MDSGNQNSQIEPYSAAKNSSSGEGLEATPQYRIVDGENGEHRFEITYDVSAFKPDDVRITLENDGTILVVTAKKEEKRGNSTVAREFKRQLEIPNSVDSKQFQCIWEQNGQLKVSAPLKFSSDHSLLAHSNNETNHSTTKNENTNTHKIFQTKISRDNQQYPSQQRVITREKNTRDNQQYPSQQRVIADRIDDNDIVNSVQNLTIQNVQSEKSNRIHSGSYKESLIVQGPFGSFLQNVMSLDSRLLNAKDIQVKVSERNRTIMVLFKIEEIQDGWSETRQISRTCKFSDSIIHSTQLKIDFSSTRAFLNSRKGLVTICVPLIGIDDSESKEIRVYTSKG